MLGDLVLIESFYGSGAPETAPAFSDLVRRYGHARVLKALRAGELAAGRAPCGAGAPRLWLTDRGRSMGLQ